MYIYPRHGGGGGAEGGRPAAVRSWVRGDCGALGPDLYHVVLAWLEGDWPFDSIEYAPRA